MNNVALQFRPPGAEVLEIESGADRDVAVERWLSGRRDQGGPTWRLRCRPQDGGVWAGMSTLFECLVPAIGASAPELLELHARELCLVLPRLQAELEFPMSLADTVGDHEKTRNYAADRAYRCLHGLIDLLAEWQQLADPGPWSIVLEDLDAANGLVQRFFSELVRRRGRTLGLRILVVVGRIEPPADPEAMRRCALALEPLVAELGEHDDELPRLIDAWERSDEPARALYWQLTAMLRYTHAGLYEAALPYAAAVEAGLERLFSQDSNRYLTAVNALFFCYVPLGAGERTIPLLERALARAAEPVMRAGLSYQLAMMHARFLPSTDQEAAEECLRQALATIAPADVEDLERHFMSVFLMNGLALVRLRQRRVSDALELCRSGVERLNEHLAPEHHRLHRSVLLFNIAQVHAQVGPHELAIEYFTQAMAMDPNYSEYYNDRGAVFFKMGELELAELDYLRAIELSPPYAEVWTNLGQCYRALGRMDAAVEAYSRAIDLEPDAALAIVGRADAHWALDRPAAALADYDLALNLDPRQPAALANRAILHYDAGRLHEAIADLDAALELAPELAELYQNRAVALRELGRVEHAARDLGVYLELCPDAEDRAEVEESLSAMAR